MKKGTIKKNNREIVQAFRNLVLGTVMHSYADKYFGHQTFVYDHRSGIFGRLDSLSRYK